MAAPRSRGLTLFVQEKQPSTGSSLWFFGARRERSEDVIVTSDQTVPEYAVPSGAAAAAAGPPQLSVANPDGATLDIAAVSPAAHLRIPTAATEAVAARRSEQERRTTEKAERRATDSRQYWVADRMAKHCYKCHTPFGMFHRRHHCRVCGQIFCYKCSSCRVPGTRLGFATSALTRVCEKCHTVVMSVDTRRRTHVDPGTPGQQVSSQAQGIAQTASQHLHPTDRRRPPQPRGAEQHPGPLPFPTHSPGVGSTAYFDMADTARSAFPFSGSPSTAALGSASPSAARRRRAVAMPESTRYEPVRTDEQEPAARHIGLFPSSGSLDSVCLVEAANMCLLTGAPNVAGLHRPAAAQWRRRVEQLAETRRAPQKSERRSGRQSPPSQCPIRAENVWTASRLEDSPDLIVPQDECSTRRLSAVESIDPPDDARMSLQHAAQAHLHNLVVRMLNDAIRPRVKAWGQRRSSTFPAGSLGGTFTSATAAGKTASQLSSTQLSSTMATALQETRRDFDPRVRPAQVAAPDEVQTALERATRRGIREGHIPRNQRRGAVYVGEVPNVPPPALHVPPPRRADFHKIQRPEELYILSDPARWASEVAAQAVEFVRMRVSDPVDLVRVCEALTTAVRHRSSDNPRTIVEVMITDPTVQSIPQTPAESVSRAFLQFEHEFIAAVSLRFCATRRVGSGERARVVDRCFLASEVVDWMCAHFSVSEDTTEAGLHSLRRRGVFERVDTQDGSPSTSPREGGDPKVPLRDQVMRLLARLPDEAVRRAAPEAPWVVDGENRFRWLVDATRVEDEKLDTRQFSRVVCRLSWKAAKTLRVFDYSERADERTMDIRERVRVLPIEGGDPMSSEYVCGTVVNRHMCHREMPTELTRPRILLVGDQIDYEPTTRVTDFQALIGGSPDDLAPQASSTRSARDFTSASQAQLGPLGSREDHDQVGQENGTWHERLTARVAATRPDVVLVERSVDLRIQRSLRRLRICLATAIGRKQLERVRRTCSASIVEDIASIPHPTLEAAGMAEPGQIIDVRVGDSSESQGIPAPVVGTSDLIEIRRVGGRSLMYLCGGEKERGGAIVLRGALRPHQRSIKNVVTFAVFAAHNLLHEVHYLLDVHGSLMRQSLYTDRRLKVGELGRPLSDDGSVPGSPDATADEETAALRSSTELLSSSLCVDFEIPKQLMQESSLWSRRKRPQELAVAVASDAGSRPASPRERSQRDVSAFQLPDASALISTAGSIGGVDQSPMSPDLQDADDGFAHDAAREPSTRTQPLEATVGSADEMEQKMALLSEVKKLASHNRRRSSVDPPPPPHRPPQDASEPQLSQLEAKCRELGYLNPLSHTSILVQHTVMKAAVHLPPLPDSETRSGRDWSSREQSLQEGLNRHMLDRAGSICSPAASDYGLPPMSDRAMSIKDIKDLATEAHQFGHLKVKDANVQRAEGEQMSPDGALHRGHTTDSTHVTNCPGGGDLEVQKLVIQYYRMKAEPTSDMPLLYYLSELFYMASARGAPPPVRHYSHNSGRITVTTELADGDDYDSHSPLAWTRCKQCGKCSPQTRCSMETLHYSFGKFLESSFFNFTVRSMYCGHSLHADCVRYFAQTVVVEGRGRVNVQVRFDFERVKVYHVSFPELLVAYNTEVFNRFVDAEFRELEEAGGESFANVTKALEELDQRLDVVEAEQGLNVTATREWVAEQQRRLDREWEEFSARLAAFAPGNRDDQGSDAVMEFNRQRCRLYHLLQDWDKEITDSCSFLLMPEDRGPADRFGGVKKFWGRGRTRGHQRWGSSDWGAGDPSAAGPPTDRTDVAIELAERLNEQLKTIERDLIPPKCTNDPFQAEPVGLLYAAAVSASEPDPPEPTGDPVTLRTQSSALERSRQLTIPQESISGVQPPTTSRAPTLSPMRPDTQPQSPAFGGRSARQMSDSSTVDQLGGAASAVATSSIGPQCPPPSPQQTDLADASGDLSMPLPHSLERQSSGMRAQRQRAFQSRASSEDLDRHEGAAQERRTSNASTTGVVSTSLGQSRPQTPSRVAGRSPRSPHQPTSWHSPQGSLDLDAQTSGQLKLRSDFRRSAASIPTPPISPRPAAGMNTTRTVSAIRLGARPKRSGARINIPESLCGPNVLMNLQPGLDGRTVIVRVDEPTSIIAYTLCSAQHQRGCETTPPQSPKRTGRWPGLRNTSPAPGSVGGGAASHQSKGSGKDQRLPQQQAAGAASVPQTPSAAPTPSVCESPQPQRPGDAAGDGSPVRGAAPQRPKKATDSSSTMNSGDGHGQSRTATPQTHPTEAAAGPLQGAMSPLPEIQDEARPSPTHASRGIGGATPLHRQSGRRTRPEESGRKWTDEHLLDLLQKETKMRRVVVEEKELDEGKKERLLFSCTVMCARQFAALRQVYCQRDEANFIASLSRCKPFGPTGGKSGSNFFKTNDDRFLCKTVKPEEMTHFTEHMAHRYFNYVARAVRGRLPTLLVKILGVFKITVIRRDNQGNSQTVTKDWMLMENLFYCRDVDRMYDLKGSRRNRFQRDQSAVQLDENLLESLKKGDWFFVREEGREYLSMGAFNDTLLLGRSSVMDYSLLVGLNAERSELYVGIIDYMRDYDLKKQTESLIKSSGIMGGRDKGPPTVISPRSYKKRFRLAVEQYFMLMPTKSTPWVIQAKGFKFFGAVRSLVGQPEDGSTRVDSIRPASAMQGP
eukprot:TRINITY_DN3303_c3_g1_i1.p1 TRINITY_DN3303_c3_g1~~TRINITY_DN3303_c3_g1_i1.p1  ORF type:complete len:2679 (+),score=741.42 TRINITY_DN3303_c3_g1_i1:333-8369(+)